MGRKKRKQKPVRVKLFNEDGQPCEVGEDVVAIAGMGAAISPAGAGATELPASDHTEAYPVPTLPIERALLPHPSLWLYTSKKLDIEWIPNAPIWAAEVITFGIIPYFRLTARVLVWLEVAGQTLQRGLLADVIPRSQMDAYLAAMDIVYEFACAYISVEDVRAARQAARTVEVTLPDVPPLIQ